MHQKLRHQLNIHKISGNFLMEQQSSLSFIPSPFFYYFFLKQPKQQTCFTIKKDSIDQACKVETILTSGREV